MRRPQARLTSNKISARIQHSSEIEALVVLELELLLGFLEASLVTSVVKDTMVDVAITVDMVHAVHSAGAAHSEANAKEQTAARDLQRADVQPGDSREPRLSLCLAQFWLELQERPSLPRSTSSTTLNSPTSQDALSEAYSLARQLRC